jgi:hypothetical protein
MRGYLTRADIFRTLAGIPGIATEIGAVAVVGGMFMALAGKTIVERWFGFVVKAHRFGEQ